MHWEREKGGAGLGMKTGWFENGDSWLRMGMGWYENDGDDTFSRTSSHCLILLK